MTAALREGYVRVFYFQKELFTTDPVLDHIVTCCDLLKRPLNCSAIGTSDCIEFRDGAEYIYAWVETFYSRVFVWLKDLEWGWRKMSLDRWLVVTNDGWYNVIFFALGFRV